MQNVGLYSLGQALLIMGIFNKIKENPKVLKMKTFSQVHYTLLGG
jgi:hypothetical protein